MTVSRNWGDIILSGARYKVDDTIEEGPYRGFIVVAVVKGWYTVYHPSNGKDATTSIRWAWAA